MKKTPLYDQHVSLGGKIVEFGGWLMPVQYAGLSQEHNCVRQKVGLFDVSHMGEFTVKGPDAENFLNYLITNNVSKLINGGALYSVMCYENGGVVDDLLVYKLAEQDYLICVNASNEEKDFAWFSEKAKPFKNLILKNESANFCQIAIQGPESISVLEKLSSFKWRDVKYYTCAQAEFLGFPCILSRTGYTGEDGFEIYAPTAAAEKIWTSLLEAGKSFGIQPCGLGARDTLRTEAKLPLYGHELSAETNPLEAGLGWVIKMEKADFVGKKAMEAKKADGLRKKLVGIRSLDRGIPRQGYEVFTEDGAKRIGVVTSGTLSPTLNFPIAIAYIDIPHDSIGTKVAVKVRDRLYNAQIVSTPFYKRTKE